ncbi:facilitated trehalose transporter Tret1-2 homolog isoform X1 [Oratosquilla oratoria]|uniref:facilitated trehalose transporter Tret1-2 homolog isoform X1 n=1 Tax=Oratosquilla oratoria TaxID=337810 RepID=UPI003F76D4B4
MTFLRIALSLRRQIACAIVIATCMLMEGNLLSWANTVVDLVQISDDNRTTNDSFTTPKLSLTEDESDWLASLPLMTSLPFLFVSGLVIDLFGLKGTTVLALILTTSGRLLMGLAPSKTNIFIGRGLDGAAYAFMLNATQPLISELVSPKIRGTLSSLPRLTSNLGVLEITVASFFLSWNHVTTLSAAPLLLVLIIIIFVPESPYWLVKKDRKEAALSSLCFLNPTADDIDNQLKEIEACVNLCSRETGVMEQVRQMKSSSNYKPVLTLAFLFVLYGSNGFPLITPYSTLLFGQMGVPLDPGLCTIYLAVARLVALIPGVLVSDLCGRKPLFIGSSILSALFLALMFLPLTVSFVPEELAVVFLLCFVLASSTGANVIPPVLIGELVPSAVQSIGCSLCNMMEIIIAGAFSFATPRLVRAVSLRFVFFIPAAANLLAAFVVWRWIPETKGKHLLEVHRTFK